MQQPSGGGGIVGTIVLVILGAAVIAMFGWMYARTLPPDPTQILEAATARCQQFVEDGLKAPATAKFGATPVAQWVDKETVAVLVTSYVDAQNGFGALIRNDYSCIIRREGEHQWLLVDLKVATR